MKSLWQLIPWQFVRFGIVGTGGFLVDSGVLLALIRLGFDRYNGQLVAFVVAASFTWLLNRIWTFGTHKSEQNRMGESARYFAAMAIGACINYAAYALLTTWGGIWEKYPIMAVAAGSIAGLCFNFPASRYYVFRSAAILPAEPASLPDR